MKQTKQEKINKMGLFKKNLKNKGIHLYVAVLREKPKNFLTITLTEDEALEYIKKSLKILNFSHFSAWCNLKDYNVDDEASWEEYLYTCASEQLEEYAVLKVFYLYKDIVAMMRMLGWCIPMGCSFDEPLEKLYFANQISPDIINEAFKNIGKDKVSENCVKDLGDLHIKEEQDIDKGD